MVPAAFSPAVTLLPAGRLPSRPMLAAALVGLLALGAAMPVAAQYQWRDAKGQLHVSDLPPPREVPEKSIVRRPARTPATAAPAGGAAPSAAASAASAPAPGRGASRPAAAEAREQAEQARRQAQRADNCQRARQWLSTLDSGQRLSRPDARGENVPLDDATRRAEAERARSAIASECG
ncbi:DUF4124 domain-containing protein [Pseudaquabacterium rugosum]|uniref:DUF4124 domain-containing protein n=1 Tax=Pseudaquabacterium rugosum TaxID=2984194 RepID=A0ABU9BDS3_9BURK